MTYPRIAFIAHHQSLVTSSSNSHVEHSSNRMPLHLSNYVRPCGAEQHRLNLSLTMSKLPDEEDENVSSFDDFANMDDYVDDVIIDDDMLLELLAMDDSDDESESVTFFEDEILELENLMDQNFQKTMPESNNMNALIPGGNRTWKRKGEALEAALMQGVVPASAGVGSNCLPGDYGFDPFRLATNDYFKQVQTLLLSFLPEKEGNTFADPGAALPSNKPFRDGSRPAALILRDYREAEIRHGRLAMLAAILWPIQEIIDRFVIPDLFGSTTMMYGGVTLPFVPLFMVFLMLLLGYLDIYAASIKENDAGDAFLPGECFWDPLSILDGAPETMKRNMQLRELNNGRMAMIAVLSYILQEGILHRPVIDLPWNQVLFEPAFEIPVVQAWLDSQFGGATRDVFDSDVKNAINNLMTDEIQ